MIQVRIDISFVDSLQQIRDGRQVLLPQGGESIQECGRSFTEVNQVLVSRRKSNPVVAGESNTGFGGGRTAVVVESFVRGPWIRTRGRRESGNEFMFRRCGLEEHHGVVYLCKACKGAAPQRGVYGSEIIEKRFRLQARQVSRKRND